MYRLFTDSGHKNQLIHVSNEKNPGVFWVYGGLYYPVMQVLS